MTTQTAKQAAHALLDRLPDEIGWDEIMYEFYVKQKIERGLTAVAQGDTVSQAEARRRLLGNEA